MKPSIRLIVAYLGYLVFILHVVGLITMVSRRAGTYPVIVAESSDAANSMNVLARTNWLKNNQFYAYGPLYYRLAHTMLSFDLLYHVATKDDLYVRDKSKHIALMIVGILSAVVLALFIATLISPWWSRGWISTLFLFTLFGASELWIDFSVDNHPDILLTLFIAMGTWATIKTCLSENRRPFLLISGIFWGLALITKLTAMTFIFGAAISIFLSAPKKKYFLVELLHFGGCILITYILIGFPQSLKFSSIIKSMSYHATATVKTFNYSFWITLLKNVMWIPFLFLAGTLLIFTPKEKGKFTTLGLIIPALSFFSLFTLTYQNHMRHYILPVTASLLIALIFPMRRLILFIYSTHPRFPRLALPILGTCVLVISIIKAEKYYLENTSGRIYPRLPLQTEAEQVQREITNLINNNKTVIADPFVPIDPRKYSINFDNGYTMDSLSKAVDADIYVASKWYFERFLSEKPNEWTLLNISEKEYYAKHNFYTKLINSESFIDNRGRSWVLNLRTSLGWEIWENHGGTKSLSKSEEKLKSFANELLFSGTPDRLLIEGPFDLSIGPRLHSKAITINGQDPFTRINVPLHALTLKQGSFAIWARLQDPNRNSPILISVNTIEGTPRTIYIPHYGSNGKFGVIFNGVQLDTKDTSVLSDKWHHYALTWENGQQRFYIDGYLTAESSAPTVSTNPRTITIGCAEGRNIDEQWYGAIAEFLTFKRALTETEVMVLYKVGLR